MPPTPTRRSTGCPPHTSSAGILHAQQQQQQQRQHTNTDWKSLCWRCGCSRLLNNTTASTTNTDSHPQLNTHRHLSSVKKSRLSGLFLQKKSSLPCFCGGVLRGGRRTTTSFRTRRPGLRARPTASCTSTGWQVSERASEREREREREPERCRPRKTEGLLSATSLIVSPSLGVADVGCLVPCLCATRALWRRCPGGSWGLPLSPCPWAFGRASPSSSPRSPTLARSAA